MLIGMLAACTPQPTPQPVATITVIPATATATMLPATDRPTPEDAIRPQDIRTVATATPVMPIIAPQIDTLPEPRLTQRIIRHLAQHLSLESHRIQLMTIQQARWFDDDTLSCDINDVLDPQNIPNTDLVDGYRYLLLAGTSTYEYHTAGNDRFVRCREVGRIRDEVLLAVDPVAADMLALVQRQLAQQLDLSTRRVQFISIDSYTWQSTALGCPRPEQTYTPAEINGYRIVVEVANDDYIYHTDAVRAIPCNRTLEQLPPS
jgi:hypothetical protein